MLYIVCLGKIGLILLYLYYSNLKTVLIIFVTDIVIVFLGTTNKTVTVVAYSCDLNYWYSFHVLIKLNLILTCNMTASTTTLSHFDKFSNFTEPIVVSRPAQY